MSEIKVLKDFDIFPLVGYINDDENVNNTQVNGAYTTVRNRFATKKQLEYVPIVELFELKDENLLFIDEEYFNKRVKEVRDKDIFERKKEESLLVMFIRSLQVFLKVMVFMYLTSHRRLK